MKRLLVTANSPGEMAGWVRPVARAWHEAGAGPVDLLLLPCTFATGQEERVARELPGVDRVYRSRDYAKLLWRHGRDYRDGALLHLGGDLMYSAALSWRWNLQAWSYLWTRPWWNNAFQGFFTKDDWGVRWLQKRKAPQHKIHLVGDLVLDSVRQAVPEAPPLTKEFQVSYLPGSRAVEVRSLAPLCLEIHSRLTHQFPGLRGVIHLSPFLPPQELTRLITSEPDPAFGGIRGYREGEFLHDGRGGGLEIATTDGYQRLAQSALALSIPGTKTAEAGYLRTPVVCITPLNRPEHLPSIGLVGLLDFLPGGNVIKGRLMLRLKPKIGLLGQPNMLAGRALLPEVLDEVDGLGLAELLAEQIRTEGRLEQVGRELQGLYSWAPRPAHRIVETILGLS